MKVVKVFAALFFAVSSLHLAAQPHGGGKPLSTGASLAEQPYQLLTPPNVERLREEDRSHPGFRFAAPIHTDLDLDNSGEWAQLPNGDRLWTLKLRAPGAKALAALYDDFFLPPGAKLFMLSEDGSRVLGAYTHHNNSRTGRFLTGFIPGETAVIEYFEPADQYGQGWFRIFRVDYAYDHPAGAEAKDANSNDDPGFGVSWPCHLNAACPPGDTLEQQKRSVCRILMVAEEGTGYCTGTLLNNARNNGVPYVISAQHCIGNFTALWDLWRFDFNYQSSTCSNPAEEPAFQSMLGCDHRSGRVENDFMLLELFYSIPASYQAFFAGWDRSSDVPSRSVFIHHPLADIKKITLDTHPAVIQNTSINWGGGFITPAMHHFKVLPAIGTYQFNSSGAGLFNQNKRFTGQLTGGYNSCDSTVAYFGRMALAWNGGGASITRLRDWLDPDNTGIMTLDGIENPANPMVAISGTVRTEAGVPIPGVQVWIQNTSADTVTTGADGTFGFPPIEPGQPLVLQFLKDNNHPNGVSTQDVIRIQRQILGIENLDSPYKQFAADVNVSGSVSTLDLIHIRRLILTVTDRFPDITSWQFFPANYSFADPDNPFGELIPNIVSLGVLQQNIELSITGIKSGDVNESANPQN